VAENRIHIYAEAVSLHSAQMDTEPKRSISERPITWPITRAITIRVLWPVTSVLWPPACVIIKRSY